MIQDSLCFYSVVRYVSDPIRDEAKNIGVIVVCPDRQFGGVRFHMSRAGLATDSPRHKMLQALIGDYEQRLQGEIRPTLLGQAPESWAFDELESLHLTCTNLVQVTKPATALADPSILLEALFRERVLPRHEESGDSVLTFPRKLVARTLRDSLQQYGKANWIREDARIRLNGNTYPFDIAVRGERLRFAIEMLTFQTTQPWRMEQRGAWYAKIWPDVHRATDAKGFLLVEPPEQVQAAMQHYRHVCAWAQDVGIEVRYFNEIPEVAEEIVQQIA